MEKDNLKIEIDMAKFHGLEVNEKSNPYALPTSLENKFLVREQVRLGFWSYVSLIFVLSWLSFISYIFVTISVTSEGKIYWPFVFFASLTGCLLVSHLLLFFRFELARKIVVFHSYLLLLGVPIGTVVGLVLLKNLRSKTFSKT